MTRNRATLGFTIVELAVVMLVIVILLAAAVPVIAGAGGNAGIQQSMANLVAQSAAHLLYAADWNGRQVTQNPDDFGAYGGDVGNYGEIYVGCIVEFDPDCPPPIIAGIGPTQSGSWAIWAYWPTPGNNILFQPINFPGPPNDSSNADGWGYWRFPQTRPIHDYLNGRYHDPVFFAPNDTSVVDPIAGCLDEPAEFVASQDCNPAWSSYGRSPAAMFHPDVFRSNADGGWQAPWDLDHGYESPGLFQATYPDLKTHLIEHSWVQNPPAPCNPVFLSCEPYYFNMGIDSAPVTLFFDGHIRLLLNSEVLFADLQVLTQTGQVDGLWHRGTPFGASGYHIDNGFDGVPLSHHVLTTDGILGRDTLGGASPMQSAVSWQPRPNARNRRAITTPRAATGPETLFAPEEDLP